MLDAMSDSPLPLANSLLFKLIRVVNLTARPFNEHVAKKHRLSINEWRAMVVLASHPGCVATDVVELTGLDKMSVSRAVAALHQEGRLEKHGDPLDHRKARLALTPEGSRLFEEIGEQAKRREDQLFAGVSDAELSELDSTLDRLLAALAPHSEAK